MGTRWHDDDFWPEVEAARPPARRHIDWALVAVYAAPLVVWCAAILLVLWAKGWIG